MPESLQELINSYGYAALLVGTFLEGETVLVLGGAAARLGYLRFEWVALCAFVGSLLGDQLWFWVGRRYGRRLLARRPGWQRRVEGIHARLERHQIPLLIGFRFVYGIRNLTPFVVGTSAISAAKFTLLNVLGAALWSVAGATLGFALAHATDALLGNIKLVELELFGAIVLAGFGFWLYRYLRIRRRHGGHR